METLEAPSSQSRVTNSQAKSEYLQMTFERKLRKNSKLAAPTLPLNEKWLL